MERNAVVGIGVQSFEQLRERKALYIDKTGLIREWWEDASSVTLITRPRRFGKTLNMSMLECFFSNRYAGRDDLFEGLSIWEEQSPEGDYRYRALQGTYPVIFISFANVKATKYEKMEYKIRELIFRTYESYRFLLDGDLLSDNEKEYFHSVNVKMPSEVAEGAINMLSDFLYRYFGRKAIIIIDEYDTPMQEAWVHGFWKEAVEFFRSFFGAAFKNKDDFEKAVITGITGISKESIFSDLNHLSVITTTSDQYAVYFGFTEKEVFNALDNVGLSESKQGVKKWYDGFTFGTYTDIYNPWSITSFIKNNGKYEAYWANTSSNGLVNSLMQTGSAAVKQTLEDLLEGKSFCAPIDEQIVFNQISQNENVIWSLLLATGYLKVLGTEEFSEDRPNMDVTYTLTLTNREVLMMFHKMVEGWFGADSTPVYYNEFINAMLDDNVRKMNRFMNEVALNTFSFFDTGNRPSGKTEPERFYHGFVLGMVVNLAGRYRVLSNRESGYGRYDVMLEPVDKKEKAFIFEFKVLDEYDDELRLEDTVANALAQIEKKQYEAQLTAAGFAPERIRKYGFAFQGARCLIGGADN
ncbi:MAG: ATP-binding protein [Lachnospiraceae bacterium]|nr:ATP-binding protein [Lachnospiraceae bacterium]